MHLYSESFLPQPSPAALIEQLRKSQARGPIMAYLRDVLSGLNLDSANIPQTSYSLYRQYVNDGNRAGYEIPYFNKRSMLTLAVLEWILGDEKKLDLIQDLLWSICEETTWVLPAHELSRQEADPSGESKSLLGSRTSLTREPEFIDLFAAETGASLAETIYILAAWLAPEIVRRVRDEIEKRIFHPYLAHGRSFWWHKDNLNWNGVCNGAIGLTFLRLENDNRRLADALNLALEGLEAYLATGFESDGGSLEGIDYWNYGLMYYIAMAEQLRERTVDSLDLLASPRMKEIARYPIAIALSPSKYFNFADAMEESSLQLGITQRLSERSGVIDLLGLFVPYKQIGWQGTSISKLAIVLRDLFWWDGQFHVFPTAAHVDAYLPACGLVKYCGRTAQGKPVILAAKAGRNTGHHYHMDIGHFVIHVDDETLLCDPGRGRYSRGYFNDQRFQNIFCNSYAHSVPRIGKQLQMPGPKFSHGALAEGKIISQEKDGTRKSVVIDFHQVYGMSQLMLARRKLELDAAMSQVYLEDHFEFSGKPLEIEEAFVTWFPVVIDGDTAQIVGQKNKLFMNIIEPAGPTFAVELLTKECQENLRDGTLTRISVCLPEGAQRFVMQMKVS